MKDTDIVMYGRHAVYEALREQPDLVKQLHVRDDVELDVSVALPVKAQRFSGKRVPCNVPATATHQGMVAVLDGSGLLISYDTWIASLSPTPDTAVVLLGEIQDPHNVGAVIRSAAAFGAAAVLLPKHRQASVTGTVIKVSAGMAFRIPLVEVPNVNRVLEDLKKRGFFSYGLAAGSTAVSLPEVTFDTPTVLVLGNEAEGIRAKTKEHCDQLLEIPIHDRCESLNAAVAAGCVLYAWSIRKGS